MLILLTGGLALTVSSRLDLKPSHIAEKIYAPLLFLPHGCELAQMVPLTYKAAFALFLMG
jgi:hypothetical protein